MGGKSGTLTPSAIRASQVWLRASRLTSSKNEEIRIRIRNLIYLHRDLDFPDIPFLEPWSLKIVVNDDHRDEAHCKHFYDEVFPSGRDGDQDEVN